MSFPKMIGVKQHLYAPTLTDVRAAVREELRKLSLAAKVKAGQRGPHRLRDGPRGDHHHQRHFDQ